MTGKWKVVYNPMTGYIVARVRDIEKAVHDGNLEYYGDFSDSKDELQAIADELNKEEKQNEKKANTNRKRNNYFI